MGKIGKTFALFLTVIIAMSCLTMVLVKPAYAQTIPKPAVPQFNVTLYDSSYDIPASATINPYNGQQTTSPATHIEARTLIFTIQNQAFTSFQAKDTNNNVNTVKLFYNLRYKGHFDQSQDWNVLFGPNFGYIQPSSGPQTAYIANGSYSSQEFDVNQFSVGFPANAQVDFQVEALIGYPSTPTIFTGQESGWSNTQTVVLNQTVTTLPSTIPQIYNSPLPIILPTATSTSTPTATPTVPEFPTWIILPLFIIVILLSIVFVKKIPKR